jgi:hypothetical protein
VRGNQQALPEGECEIVWFWLFISIVLLRFRKSEQNIFGYNIALAATFQSQTLKRLPAFQTMFLQDLASGLFKEID